MSVLALVAILVLLGAAAWFVETQVPIDAWFKWLIRLVLIIVAVVVVLSAFGILSEVTNVQVPHI